MKEETYVIGGMSCAACSAAVERVTRKIPGVERSDVNLTTNRMTIAYDETQVTPELIISKVEKAGFTARQNDKRQETVSLEDEEELEYKAQRKRIIAAAALSVVLLYVSMGQMLVDNLPMPDIFSMHTHPVNYALLQLLLTIPILYCGRKFFTVGYKALFHLNPNMDTLVALGSTASFVYSVVMTFLISDTPGHVHHLYFESAAVVVTLVMLGKHLEAGSKQKTKGAIKKLTELRPETALLYVNDVETEVPVDTLRVGDIILVKAGARVPADSVVINGAGSVDESMLTGESMPVDKSEGDELTGGSMAVSGAVYARITRLGEDSTLSGIIRLVEDAQGRKAPISKIADKVAGVFVPVVMAIAVIAAAAWLIAGQELSFALQVFTAVLVIACPCALGLATPTAIICGTGLGAGNGILIRSGEALETTHKITTAVLDKTGTVTAGKPSVTEVISLNMPDAQLLGLCASAERLSEHPLAKAIVEYAQEQGTEKTEVSDYETLTGRGVSAKLPDGREICVGNARLMAERGADITQLRPDFERLSSEGQTPMFVSVDGKAEGLVSVADTVLPTSAPAVAEMKKQGLRVVLLTGDNRAAAEHIASVVGVDECIAEVLPQDKASVVSKLQEQGEMVMMVGDGINDAPALAQADVGCAIGGGSDIAIESADIIIMKNDLRAVPRAVKLSRLTIRNIKQNLFWAFCYNTIGIPIAAGILYPINGMLLNPMLAGLAMSLSSVCVVTNALRLRGKKL